MKVITKNLKLVLIKPNPTPLSHPPTPTPLSWGWQNVVFMALGFGGGTPPLGWRGTQP